MACLQLEKELENLKGSGYDKYPISPETLGRIGRYNCIAYAAGETDKWWWPHPNRFDYYWPPQLPREFPNTETLENFVQAFECKGYQKCKNGKHKRGIEKVVIFVNRFGRPTHAARQLESGVWTSKCGRLEDIQHETLSALEGGAYGSAHTFLHRRRDGRPFWKDRMLALLKRIKELCHRMPLDGTFTRPVAFAAKTLCNKPG